ncbi:hypothetical protein DFH08DRAFT_915978 [Mycena albidolilacea]|uniref:CxC2-like cysteine cluster KDZ transposase-associated domain-containing protein n=1 Tax=Mycena albidolilacea TaxID=1033008 RepID=A0AAD7ELI3_9AGAR|nr:hypothetical protein DFH08DRAFT_915978 [Mycena albidolilacea]
MPPRVRRIRGRHLEILPSASTSVSSHSFSPADLIPQAEVHRPISTFVDRPSEDLRRIYRDVVPIEPPSPIKRARLSMAEGGPSHVPESAPDISIFDDSQALDERYDMFFDSDGRATAPAHHPPARTRKAIYSVCFYFILLANILLMRSFGGKDPVLYEWKANSRDRYLLEFLRLHGCGGRSVELCPDCQNPARPCVYRCRDCMGGVLRCRECCVARHLYSPLHRVEAWGGSCFWRTSLKALGLRVQFGHAPGEFCASPEPGRSEFVVLHHNGIHDVAVDFCGCEHRGQAGGMDTQLLRGGWYPASQDRPQTCMTLVALEQFHIVTCQAKTTMYDYYQTLVKLTSNDGTKPPDRYQVFIRICREYRHLIMLKRGGRGHDAGGARATQSGELAVRCPACPRPGVNLPDGWENATKDQRFIYVFFLAIDACFRLKRRLVSSELKDPGLGTGMLYLLEDTEFREFLLTVTDQVEMSTCSGLAALDYANTKFLRGYSSTGVGMGVCARHEFIQLNGVGDLQRGERYANMDYIFGSILRHHSPSLRKTISYDIVCQWWKHLMERLLVLPPLVRCAIVLGMMVFVIPKMHIEGHDVDCGALYSLNLIPGSGQTDGEGIERPWANIGGIASSTRIMGPGARHDTIDDHWAYWNWQKLISLAATLWRKLDTALEQQVIQREALDAFSLAQQDCVEGWKKMIHDFEEDPTLTNPYKVDFAGLTEMDVRLQFQKKEEEAAKRGLPAKHKVSPGGFIVECLEVEEEQYVFFLDMWAELKKAKTTTQQINIGALRTKLIRRLNRLRQLQGTYCPAVVVALEKRNVPEDEQPENEPLFLPSALSEVQRAAGGCSPGLLEMEQLMRDAQCRSSLVKLRNQLIIKARFLNYKSLHARHQGATTRSRTIVSRNETKIRLHSEKYQAAWSALLAAAGGNVSQVGWQKLVHEDIRCMEDSADLESRREVLWIWAVAGNSGSDAGFENECVALRIEWSKAYVRSRRWDEEVMLLKEEFRRLPISLEFEAERWVEHSRGVEARSELEEAYVQGMRAYAAQQEVLFQNLADQARATEIAPKLARGKGRVRTRAVDPLQDTEVPASDGENGDDDAAILAAVQDEDTDEERGEIKSDEEVIMGGELDNI